MNQSETVHAWWSRLRHQGLLLSPVVMLERFDVQPEPAPFYVTRKIRDAFTRFCALQEKNQTHKKTEIDQNAILQWVDILIEQYLGHGNSTVARQHSIPENLTTVIRIGNRSETIRPHRVISAVDSSQSPALLIMADISPKVGQGRGRTAYARFVELLRGTGQRLGLLTNGRQFRLIYAGMDFESWCEWDAERWFDEGEGSEELLGFKQLLSPDSLYPPQTESDKKISLLQAVEESRKKQSDLSSVLRENVRQAVERLLDEVSIQNRANPNLLNLVSNRDQLESLGYSHQPPEGGKNENDNAEDETLNSTIKKPVHICNAPFKGQTKIAHRFNDGNQDADGNRFNDGNRDEEAHHINGGNGTNIAQTEVQDALLQASVRVIMRLVVCLFAESRELLPVNDPIYNRSYGVRTLYELLEERIRVEGGTYNLHQSHSAWPRLMALFRLIHSGSVHSSFPLRAYGGALFRPGDPASDDPVIRALAVLEHSVKVNDAAVREILLKLLHGPLPIVRGRTRTYIEGPVDYTGLRTEFIGLIYEGLLDYRLKRAEDGSPQVFLNIGREPVLPLVRLEDMLQRDPKGLKDLLTKLKKEKVTAAIASEEEETGEDETDEFEEPESEEEPSEIMIEETSTTGRDFHSSESLDADQRARMWANQAVVLVGMVPKQKKREANSDYQRRIEEAAKQLIKRVIAPGEFYLVRAGNTRKGTGTFYTKPQLAVPTVHRTLEPLCYTISENPRLESLGYSHQSPEGDKNDINAPFKGQTKIAHRFNDGKKDVDDNRFNGVKEIIPKRPEEILSLKICDPACGSASFLVAALHYVTDALYASLRYHCGIEDPHQAKTITLPYGKPRTGKAGEEIVPFPPDDPQRGHTFTERIKALLRRHVVERCIYGVDINPLAVEFARVSLWVETLDKELPFTFLDHKIKVGNSLVGCWLNRVLNYPIKAWEREGGDGKSGVRTERIETFLKGEKVNGRRSGNGIIKDQMRSMIETKFLYQPSLFADQNTDITSVVEHARQDYERLHDFPITNPDEREKYYREHVQRSDILRRLKLAMDEWCAVWFWPMDEISAPLVPTPLTFHKGLSVQTDELQPRLESLGSPEGGKEDKTIQPSLKRLGYSHPSPEGDKNENEKNETMQPRLERLGYSHPSPEGDKNDINVPFKGQTKIAHRFNDGNSDAEVHRFNDGNQDTDDKRFNDGEKDNDGNQTKEILEHLVKEIKFFHWEIEFPDVFTPHRSGFDAVIGNPPWENAQPNLQEFFSDYDPLFRTYGRIESLQKMEMLFKDLEGLSNQWISHCGFFKAFSNWVTNISDPFGDSNGENGLLGRGGSGLMKIWKERRQNQIGYVSATHPFNHQTGRMFTYKLFLELGHYLLVPNGRLGMIVPSGLYTDSWSQPLRELFLEQCTWEWLFSFENRKKIFDIDGRFKFAPTIVDRCKRETALKAAFMVHDLKAWEQTNPPVFNFDRSLIPLFSPRSKSLPEVRTIRDLEICRKIYGHSIRIGDNAPGWEIEYAIEFMMNTDAKHFPPLEKWQEKGYQPDIFGRWISPEGEMALPLYEGRMIGQFDFSQKGWVSGKGRTAVWREIPFDDKKIEPQYLMAEEVYTNWEKKAKGIKFGLMSIGSATNSVTSLLSNKK